MKGGQQLPSHALSPVSVIRIQARAIWRGPQSVELHDDGGVSFYGWRTLALELRPGKADRIESRSVYANLYDRTQPTAILRAVYWDGELVRRQTKQPEDKDRPFRLKVPARFVQMPVDRLVAWLAQLEGVSIPVDDMCGDDGATSIRRLRIERDYLSCIFEKVWRLEDPKHARLNKRWDQIWQEMNTSLTNEQLVGNVVENFWFVKPRVRYDLRAYDISLIAPK